MEKQINPTYIKFVCQLNNQKKNKKYGSQSQLCLESLEETDSLRMERIK